MSKAGTLADNYEQAVGMVALGKAFCVWCSRSSFSTRATSWFLSG
jgi:hypothetical protein